MKQAPLRGFRWRPGESVGTKSGMRLWWVMVTSSQAEGCGPDPVCD